MIREAWHNLKGTETDPEQPGTGSRSSQGIETGQAGEAGQMTETDQEPGPAEHSRIMIREALA